MPPGKAKQGILWGCIGTESFPKDCMGSPLQICQHVNQQCNRFSEESLDHETIEGITCPTDNAVFTPRTVVGLSDGLFTELINRFQVDLDSCDRNRWVMN